MNAKKGRNGMNGNKIKTALLIGSVLFLHDPTSAETGKSSNAGQPGELSVTQTVVNPTALKQEKPKPTIDYLAPTLYGLREVLVPYPMFVEPRASNDCGLNRETLLTVMQRNLQDPNLEIMLLEQAHERQATRANLTYEIHTSKIDQTCLSWINVQFSDKASITLSPLKVPKALTVTYWQKSGLARSPQDRHQTAVGDALAAMGRQFLREVKLAEPATYSVELRKPEASDAELKAEKHMDLLRSLNESVSKRLLNSSSGADIIQPKGQQQEQNEERP